MKFALLLILVGLYSSSPAPLPPCWLVPRPKAPGLVLRGGGMLVEGEARRRPPWQMGPRCQHLVGLNVSDPRGYSVGYAAALPVSGIPPEVLQGAFKSREAMEEARRGAKPPTMRIPKGNVSHIDDDVAWFTHEELLRFRPPGGGPIDRIPEDRFEDFREKRLNETLNSCPYGPDEVTDEYGLDPTLRFRFHEPRDPLLRTRMNPGYNPERIPRLLVARQLHHMLHAEKVMRQAGELGSLSGHNTKNEQGEHAPDTELMMGQVPEHDLRVENDESMRVWDARLCQELRMDEKGTGPPCDQDTESMYQAVNRAEADGDAELDEWTQEMRRKMGDWGDWAAAQGKACYGALDLQEGRIWALSRWGYPLTPPMTSGGHLEDPECMASSDVSSDTAAGWSLDERRRRRNRKQRLIQKLQMNQYILRRTQDEWARRERRKLIRLAKREVVKKTPILEENIGSEEEQGGRGSGVEGPAQIPGAAREAREASGSEDGGEGTGGLGDEPGEEASASAMNREGYSYPERLFAQE